MAITAMLCTFSLQAAAWTLNTWVKSPGGGIKVGNDAEITSLDGSVFRTFDPAQGCNVAVTAAPNHIINNLIINGMPTQPANPKSVTIAAPSGGSSIWVDFIGSQLAFNVVAGPHGFVLPRGLQPNVTIGSTYRLFTFFPEKGESVTRISADRPDRIVFSSTLLNRIDKKVVVVVSSISGDVTLTGTFSGNSGNGGTGTPSTIAARGRACDSCHLLNGIDAKGDRILKPWSSGIHKAQNVLCVDCHKGAGSGGHPGVVQCAGCHDTHGMVPAPHNLGLITPEQCAGCHSASINPHHITDPSTLPLR